MPASPIFTINSTSTPPSVSVAAGAAVTATLVSTDGVRSVAWSISRTDDTTTPGSYSLTPSGAIGQTVGTTALTAGTAAVLRCVINAGIDPQTEQPSDAMAYEAKFYVPTAAGAEVLCAQEQDDDDVVSSATHGAVKPINAVIRSGLGSSFTYDQLLNAATGNEVSFPIEYTINKATSGDDTGIKITRTDTLSPGTSYFLDCWNGGARVMSLTDYGGLIVNTNFIAQSNGTSNYRATSDVIFDSGIFGASPVFRYRGPAEAEFETLRKSSVQTTNATPTTIETIALSDNTTYNIIASVTGDVNAGANSAGYVRMATVKRTGGGGATLVGTVSTPHTGEDDGAWDCTIVVSGNNALVQVTGAGGTTIDWDCVSRVTQ